MRKYSINIDMVVNQLTPFYLNGRKYLLFVQSLLYPIQVLSNKFNDFCNDKHIEARMTSQIMYFEWFLNKKLSKYFYSNNDKITILQNNEIGVDIYYENSEHFVPYTVFYNLYEVATVTNPEEFPRALYNISETQSIVKASFIVQVPIINGISQQEFVNILSSIVNKYKLAGKTYLIVINNTEVEPNKNI